MTPAEGPPPSDGRHSQVSANRHGPVPLCMAKKWLPVTHRHGCAIYWHQNVLTAAAGEEEGQQQDQRIGGELMVSCIIKGTPQQCLDALLSSRCGNSILGPATAVEGLQESADGTVKVLEVGLAPLDTNTESSSSSSRNRKRASFLTRLCSKLLRSRCAVVQQTLCQNSSGIHCLMFHSCSPSQVLSSTQQQQQHPEVAQLFEGLHANGHTSNIANGAHRVNNDSSSSTGRCNGQHVQQEQQQRPLASKSYGDCLQQSPRQVQLQASCHSSASNNNAAPNNQQQNHHHQQQQQQQYQPQHRQQQLQQPPQPSNLLPQQQVCRAKPATPLLLRPVLVLLSCLGSLLSLLAWLLGLNCGSSRGSSSSRSSRARGLWWWGPVEVDVVGGFTVAGLDTAAEGDDDDEAAGDGSSSSSSETLVTSILKVDPGGWLSSSSSSNGPSRRSLVSSAAARVGLTDLLVQQLVSAVERIKEEVEHPPPTPTAPRSGGGGGAQASNPAAARGSSSMGAAVKGLVTNLASLATLALSPLTAWQQQQQSHPSARSSSRSFFSRPGLFQRSWLSQASAPGRLGGRSSSISGSWGRRESCASGSSAAGSIIAAGQGVAADLVGVDQLGRPLTGLCDHAFWSPLHQPGCPALFQVRGPTYLCDHVKVAAGDAAYTLLAVDLVSTPTAVHHLARFLPSVRRSRAASCFVFNMMVPAANDVMNLVMTFGCSKPWPVDCTTTSSTSSTITGGDSNNKASNKGSGAAKATTGSGGGGGSSGAEPSSSGSGSSGDTGAGFQNTLRRFLMADDHERSNMLKMIPHIEVGPWMLQQMVGTTPVIMGRKLATTYHLTERYMEVDIDVTTCRTAGFIVQSIRGATTSLVVDLCYLMEAQQPDELPEELIGAVRFSNLDMSATTPLDTSTEIPCWPQPW